MINRATRHARPLANGLSGIHCFGGNRIPLKTGGNDGDRN